jgi:hypothetical protein
MIRDRVVQDLLMRCNMAMFTLLVPNCTNKLSGWAGWVSTWDSAVSYRRTKRNAEFVWLVNVAQQPVLGRKGGN